VYHICAVRSSYNKECGILLDEQVFHGNTWSPEVYASLIKGDEDDAIQDHYAVALRASGVRDVANGLVVGRRSGGGDRATSRYVGIYKSDDQIWQTLAKGDIHRASSDSHELRGLVTRTVSHCFSFGWYCR